MTMQADSERRFGALRRLYGDAGYARLRAASIAVVGLGGVGSWAAEALARSGIARLALIDLDHVAESNVNRQLQATSATLGMAKAQALAQRVHEIHPDCEVAAIEAFVEEGNWPGLIAQPVDVVIDACDDLRAKTVLSAWAMKERRALVVAGAAGGKRRAEAVEVADLADATHDPLLAALRQRLRKQHGAPPAGPLGVSGVFSREPVARPSGDGCDVVEGGLNCHGYGSVVAVTATFGFVAAGVAIELLLRGVAAPRGIGAGYTSPLCEPAGR